MELRKLNLYIHNQILETNLDQILLEITQNVIL